MIGPHDGRGPECSTAGRDHAALGVSAPTTVVRAGVDSPPLAGPIPPSIPESDKQRWQEFFKALPWSLLAAAGVIGANADRSGSALLMWVAVGSGVTGVAMFAVRLWRSRE